MTIRALLLLPSVALFAISCTFSMDGLGARSGDDDAASDNGGAGRSPVSPSGSVVSFADAGVVAGPSSIGGAPVDAAAVAPPDAAVTGPPATPVAPAPADAAALPPAPDAAPVAVPPAPTTPPAPPQAAIVHAHDVHADHITARVVYAHKLDAMSGTVDQRFPASILQVDLGEQDLTTTELVVDTLFAHDIKAKSVQIGEAHADISLPKPKPDGKE